VNNCAVWLFGRGLSIACNLTWTVPHSWLWIPRWCRVALIKRRIRSEMNRPIIRPRIIQAYLQTIQNRTQPGWRHLFVTTNWDYLLQKEIEALHLTVQPPWMANSHVFHVNGTVEVLANNTKRSPFLLEQDQAAQRHFTPEASMAYGYMIWQRTFIVVGMSFECETDRFLLSALNRVEDDLPIGESTWFLVNSHPQALATSSARISTALPHARVIPLATTFEAWLNNNCAELRAHGVLN